MKGTNLSVIFLITVSMFIAFLMAYTYLNEMGLRKGYTEAKDSTLSLKYAIDSVAYHGETGNNLPLPKDYFPTTIKNECYRERGEVICGNTKVKCGKEDGEFKCEISNFYLPQKVSKPEDWILGFGDPKFLVYYESFPKGEASSWSGLVTAGENVGMMIMADVAFSTVTKGVVGKLKRLAGKEAWKGRLGNLIKKSEKLSKLSDKLGIAMNKVKKLKLLVFSKTMSKPQRIKTIKRTILDDYDLASKTTIKGQAETLSKAMGVSSKALGRYIRERKKTLGAIALATYAANWIDSRNEKYINHTNSLVLKTPFKEPDTFELLEEVENYDVILDKRLSIRDKRFYYASPCHIDVQVYKDEGEIKIKDQNHGDYENGGDNFCFSTGMNLDTIVTAVFTVGSIVISAATGGIAAPLAVSVAGTVASYEAGDLVKWPGHMPGDWY